MTDLRSSRIDAVIEELWRTVELAEAEIEARERAERNAIIDEERERERLADEEYMQRIVELEEERRNDH